MELTSNRKEKYAEIDETIGNTALVPYKGPVPDSNRILIKRELDNPFGSHYDRVYLELFKYHEESGNIKPGDKILETTSGSAGVSYAGIGRLLGYECFVALPAGGEKARERAILEQLPDEDHLIFTPAEQYVNGFPRFLKRFLPRNRDVFFLNHSMGKRDQKRGRFANNEVTLGGLAKVGEEVLAETEVDYFFPAVGNGSSVLGISRPLRQMRNVLLGAIGGMWEENALFSGGFNVGHVNEAAQHVIDTTTSVIPFETFQAAALYDLKYPGEYERRFEIPPGKLSRHELPGTSFQGIDFPHIRGSLEEILVDDVVLVSSRKMDKEFEEETGKDNTKILVHLDTPIEGHKDLGKSSIAGINVALEAAKRVEGKTMLVVGYDHINRYDS